MYVNVGLKKNHVYMVFKSLMGSWIMGGDGITTPNLCSFLESHGIMGPLEMILLNFRVCFSEPRTTQNMAMAFKTKQTTMQLFNINNTT